MMKSNQLIIIVAMICITILGSIGVLMGHDGILLTGIIAAITGLAGYVMPQPKFIK